MIYCVSDLHGCYDSYLQLLDTIGFSASDTLYVLGDCVDRGKHGIDILLDIAARPNVVLLSGNHEYLAASLLQWVGHPIPAGIKKEDFLDAYRVWFDGNGGIPTYWGYRELSPERQAIVMDVMRRAPLHLELDVSGRHFHLSHTLPEYESWKQGCWEMDYITGDPDYEICYSPDCLFVTGHTPTELIDPKSKGRIWQQKNHIAIDCGAVFGNPLGCICLNNLKEYYV